MSLTLYALFPNQYVPQHAVLAKHTHKPDSATEIIRKDGRKSSVISYMDRIIRVMKHGEPMTRAEIQRKANVSKAAAQANLLKLIEQRKVHVSSGRLPHYWWVV